MSCNGILIRKKENKMDSSNAWVFVSHSNKDFEKVINVRDKLETLQYRPLLFFLKCLEDDREIFELVKREIKARDRFILCDSKNSRESEWVQKEKDFILSLKRPYEIVNIDGTEEEIDESIARFNRRSTVYLWSTDERLEQMVKERLVRKSFRTEVLQDDFFRDYYLFKTGSPDLVGESFSDVISNGYVLIIISRKLTEKEELYIELTAGYFRRYTNSCRIYTVSKESMHNGGLYYELRNADGIQPQIIFKGTLQERNDVECADKIVNDVVKMDNYNFQLLQQQKI